jgi:hypothetical protein
MQTVTLKAFFHRQQECIGIFYPPNNALNTLIKKIPKAKWSETCKCWYLPLSKENYTAITTAMQSKATIDNSPVKAYLLKKNKVAAVTIPAKKTTGVTKPVSPTSTA